MEAGKQNLPESIYHFAHGREYPLFLRKRGRSLSRDSDKIRSICFICLNKIKVGDYFYGCDGEQQYHHICDFTVDIACSSIKAGVDFQGHKHQLCFIERVNPSYPLKCESCKESTSELLFRCMDDSCDYSLHLSCGPLPVAIPYNHGGHDFTLTLKDAFLDGADIEDSWCDVCEERRDPLKCVYRSEDPPFTATIDCLLPQIVGALQGDHGEVKLRSVRRHMPGVVLVTAQESTEEEVVTVEREIQNNAVALENSVDPSFHGEESAIFDGTSMFDSIPREEKEFMERALDELEKRLPVKGIKIIPYRYSDPAFEQFKELSITGADNLSSWMSTPLMEELPRFVKVGDNLVPPELVPLYHRVIEKHGDFTSHSRRSPIVKAIILAMLLMLIQETVGLQIREVTGVLLSSLQLYLEFVNEKFGFDVQFALDNVEKLARACYALRFVKVRDNITADLTKHIEQLEREIPEDKPKIKALKEQYGRAKESAFVKQCLAEASALRWKNAGEFLGM